MNIIFLTLAIYFVLMLGIAWYSSRKEGIETYFLNKRQSSLWLLTFSNVATIVGAGATVAIVSEVYNSGISYGLALPFSFLFGAILLGIFSKKIREAGDRYDAYTLVDFFGKRFGTKNKILVGFLQIFLILMWIALQTTAVATLASVLTGVDYSLAILLSVGVTIIYTSVGGLKADILTDFFQFWIILIVFVILAIVGYHEIGSFTNLFSQIPAGHLDPFAFGGIGWTVFAVLFGGFIYLSNSAHWQRILSAKDEKTAQKSFWWSIPFLIILSVIVLFFGLLATVLLSGINQDEAIFELMSRLLPSWFVGIGFASILAVIMSSLDSIMIGGSTIIYRAVFKKNQFENKKEIFYARIITVLFGTLGGAIAFLIPSIVTLSLLVTYLTLIFTPAILAGFYSKKISSDAIFYSLFISFILTIILFITLGQNNPLLIISIIVATLIILLYDKIFKKKDNNYFFM